MGSAKSSQNTSSRKSSSQSTNTTKITNTDSRSYQNTDSRSYQKTDSRSYKNVDSRDMSTTVNSVDNRNINETALDCGVDPSDVENYSNDESININQDNSQNIVVSGDGNTLENISQKMNLTSYGPNVQKCMQDAVNKMASASKTDMSSKKAGSTTAQSGSSNTTSAVSENTSGSSADISSKQSDAITSETAQTSKQSAKASAAAGGGFEIILVLIIILIVLYSTNSIDQVSPNPLGMITEFIRNSLNSTHVIIILITIIILYESIN